MKIFDQILGTLSEYLHKRGMGTAPSNGLLDFKRLNTYSPQFSPGNSWPGGDLVMKALVKNLTFVLLGSVVTFNIHAQNPDRIITPYEIEQGQNKAVELYEDGKYEEAFEESSIAAQRGMKTAQYLLGIMFLKGEYVQQSLPIGMAWLGVASEADQDDWHATYKQVYDSLPANAQAAIDAKVSTYIDLYGLKAQKVRCVKRARTGQRRIEEICEKNGSITPLYSLEGVPENFTSRIGTCDEPWPCQFGTLRLDLENVNLRDLGPF